MYTMVMTGGTSGIGAVALSHITAHPGTRVLLGSRGPTPAGAERIPLDLTSLDSVRAFVAQVRSSLGTAQINALVCNAGVLQPDLDGRSADGFETTFAVNHLAHHDLVRLLEEQLAPGAHVVLTTSGTHDPGEGAGLPVPDHADAERLAHPWADDIAAADAGKRAYGASKLCNILTVRKLSTTGRDITPIAYCPGQTPGTGLTRDMPLALRLGWRVLGGPLNRLVPDMNRLSDAGNTLASIALGEFTPPDGAYYATLRRGTLLWKAPSELAQSDEAMEGLWSDSDRLVGLGACRA